MCLMCRLPLQSYTVCFCFCHNSFSVCIWSLVCCPIVFTCSLFTSWLAYLLYLPPAVSLHNLTVQAWLPVFILVSYDNRLSSFNAVCLCCNPPLWTSYWIFMDILSNTAHRQANNSTSEDLMQLLTIYHSFSSNWNSHWASYWVSSHQWKCAGLITD